MPHTESPPALIYVIEDDLALGQLLLGSLQEYGFHGQVFRDGSSALRRLQVEAPDLCIVDLGLPDMDGIELVQTLTQRCNCGVLILTGRGHPADRVLGLELGGDDYVVKPFETRELVARIRSILRRRGSGGSPVAAGPRRRLASFLDWELDCAANVLRSADGTEHLLGTAEVQVLRSFVERPHQILTRQQLTGDRDLSPLDRSIDVRISRLRRRLEEDPQNPRIIKTVYGAGYMFAAKVEWR